MKNGAVNIFNSPNVIVKNCKFYNNTSDSSYIRPFQANSGGLSISYNFVTASIINITVTGCEFINNVATAVSDIGIRIQLQNFLSQNTSGGTGGGLAIVVNTSSVLHCIVSNSLFINNRARFAGGGVYCVAVEAYDDHRYIFENIMFEGNSASVAGAIGYGAIFERTKETLYTLVVFNCTFMDNNAGIAGAIHISLNGGIANNSVTFKQCTFTNNLATDFAGTVDIVSHDFYVDRSDLIPVAFVDW